MPRRLRGARTRACHVETYLDARPSPIQLRGADHRFPWSARYSVLDRASPLSSFASEEEPGWQTARDDGLPNGAAESRPRNSGDSRSAGFSYWSASVEMSLDAARMSARATKAVAAAKESDRL